MQLGSRENRIYQFDKMGNFMISLGYAFVSHSYRFASVVDYRGCCVFEKQRKTAKEQRTISLFFGRQAIAGPGFLRRTRCRSLIISCQNSKNRYASPIVLIEKLVDLESLSLSRITGESRYPWLR